MWPFLAAAAAKHNAADDQQESERQRDYIAEPREGWRRVGSRREHGVDHVREHEARPAEVDVGRQPEHAHLVGEPHRIVRVPHLVARAGRRHDDVLEIRTQRAT